MSESRNILLHLTLKLKLKCFLKNVVAQSWVDGFIMAMHM